MEQNSGSQFAAIYPKPNMLRGFPFIAGGIGLEDFSSKRQFFSWRPQNLEKIFVAPQNLKKNFGAPQYLKKISWPPKIKKKIRGPPKFEKN